MTLRKALLLGLNYVGTSAELQGCHHDANNLAAWLTQTLHWDPDDLLLMTDATPITPTRQAMVRALRDLALWSHRHPGSQVFISYSGHGSQVADTGGDERDRQDEVLVPLDWQTAGLISDDEFGRLLRQFHASTDVVVLVDACHSGSIGDLPYHVIAGNEFVIENDTLCDARVLLISGCDDIQTSAEVLNLAGESRVDGVMTTSFLRIMQDRREITCLSLIRYMWEFLQTRGYIQRPQLTSSRPLTETTVFITGRPQQPFFIRPEG